MTVVIWIVSEEWSPMNKGKMPLLKFYGPVFEEGILFYDKFTRLLTRIYELAKMILIENNKFFKSTSETELFLKIRFCLKIPFF